jgi:hypothetical protein
VFEIFFDVLEGTLSEESGQLGGKLNAIVGHPPEPLCCALTRHSPSCWRTKELGPYPPAHSCLQEIFIISALMPLYSLQQAHSSLSTLNLIQLQRHHAEFRHRAHVPRTEHPRFRW